MFKYTLVIFLCIIVQDRSCAIQAIQPNNDQDNGLLCNFEDGKNCTFVPSYNPGNFAAKWTIVQGGKTSVKAIDHTNHSVQGHFYGIDFGATSGRMIYTFRMRSKEFAPTRGTCVSFSYQMNALIQNEVLIFYIWKKPDYHNTPYFREVGDLGPSWHNYRATVRSSVKWQLYFEFEAAPSGSGLVAIDDLRVDMDKPCPESNRCDFERGDTCMWESIFPTQPYIAYPWRWPINRTEEVNKLIKTNFTWTVTSPDREFNTLLYYPKHDHTLGTPYGNYLLLKNEFPRKVGDRAVLMSEIFIAKPKALEFCLRFYYYAYNPLNTTNTTRLEIFRSEAYDRITKLAQIANVSTTLTWTQFSVTTKLNNSGNLWFYLVGTVGSSRDSFIAIDDMIVEPGTCKPQEQTKIFQCSPTQSIPQTKVCNGVKDCSNGLDEQNCGSCDFKNNTACGYSQLLYDEYGFVQYYQWYLGNSSLGPEGGPGNTTDFILTARNVPGSSYNGTADLISPELSSSTADCYIDFKYNIHPIQTAVKQENISHLSLLVDANGFETVEIWNSDVIYGTDATWVRCMAYIGQIRTQYRLIFRAIDQSYKNDSYIALSDVKLSPSCYYNPIMSTCSSDMYRCANAKCISQVYVCDFNDDCGDNSDEIEYVCSKRKLNCNFEHGQCSWGRYRMDQWRIKSGMGTLIKGPTRDHTKGIESGNFLYLSAQPQNAITLSTINGPSFDPAEKCYMVFWASMQGYPNSTRYIRVWAENLKTGSFIEVYQFKNLVNSYKGFSYQRYVVDLGHNNYQFRVSITGQISGYTNRTDANYIAMDDISFSSECIPVNTSHVQTSSTTNKPVTLPVQSSTTPINHVTQPDHCKNGQFQCLRQTQLTCIDRSLVCDFHNDCPNGDNSDEANCGNCNFDSGSMCGWTNIALGKEQWTIANAAKMCQDINLPCEDGAGNKTGSYLILDSSKGGTNNIPAVITTPVLGATSDKCKMQFEYRYSNPGPNAGKLVVSLWNSITYTSKQLLMIDQANALWITYIVPLGKLSAGYQVQISGIGSFASGTEPYVDMELDEIKFINCDPKHI